MKNANLPMKVILVIVWLSPVVASILQFKYHFSEFKFWMGFIPIAVMMLLAIIHGLMVQFHIRFKPLELFSCWIGWHWIIEAGEWDGASYHGVCKGCGKSGKYDGMGNFFV